MNPATSRRAWSFVANRRRDNSSCSRVEFQLSAAALTPLYVKTSRATPSRMASDGLGEGGRYGGCAQFRGAGGRPCPMVDHDAVVDLTGQEPFDAADDLAFGHALGGASRDVVDGGLVEAHPPDRREVEGGIGLPVAAAVEAVPAGGHPRRRRDRAGAAEFGEGCFGSDPFPVVAEDDQHLGGGVRADTEPIAQRRRRVDGELVEVPVVVVDLVVE